MTHNERLKLNRMKKRYAADDTRCEALRNHADAQIKCDSCNHKYCTHVIPQYHIPSENLTIKDICKYAHCYCRGFIHPESEQAKTRTRYELISRAQGYATQKRHNSELTFKQEDEFLDFITKMDKTMATKLGIYDLKADFVLSPPDPSTAPVTPAVEDEPEQDDNEGKL